MRKMRRGRRDWGRRRRRGKGRDEMMALLKGKIEASLTLMTSAGDRGLNSAMTIDELSRMLLEGRIEAERPRDGRTLEEERFGRSTRMVELGPG